MGLSTPPPGRWGFISPTLHHFWTLWDEFINPPRGGMGIYIPYRTSFLLLVLLSAPGRGMFRALHTLRQETTRATMPQETAGNVYTLVRERLWILKVRLGKRSSGVVERLLTDRTGEN